MKNRAIIGIKVLSFTKCSGQVQEIFKEHGCSIRTRLGLHDVNDGVCDPKGIILLEFIGDAAEQKALIEKIEAIGNVQVKTMSFE